MPRKMKIMIMPCKICNENIFEFLCKNWLFGSKVDFRSTINICWLFPKKCTMLTKG
jgi:hypothetical protein